MAQARLYFYAAAAHPRTGGSTSTFVLCLGNEPQTLRRCASPSSPTRASYEALLGGIRAAASLGVAKLEVWGSSRGLVKALARSRGTSESAPPWPFNAACVAAAGTMRCSYVSVYPENNLAARS
jgi:ribonuclease HI